MSTPSTFVKSTTADTFEADVIEQSRECIVLVDFWAPWCEPCRQLGPILEKLTNEFAGKVRMVKIDVDASPELAGAFGVQSIPHVVAMQDAQPVDQFNGVLSEAELREWLTQLLPSRSEELLGKGMELEATDPAAAEACYREAAELSPEEDRLKIAMARVILAQNRDEEAARILATLEARGYLEPEAERIKSELQVRADAEEAGDASEARRAADASPDDLTLRLKLADALAVDRKHEEALQICLDLIDQDKAGIGPEAKDTMVRIFDMLGPSSELTTTYRRKLSNAWY